MRANFIRAPPIKNPGDQGRGVCHHLRFTCNWDQGVCSLLHFAGARSQGVCDHLRFTIDRSQGVCDHSLFTGDRGQGACDHLRITSDRSQGVCYHLRFTGDWGRGICDGQKLEKAILLGAFHDLSSNLSSCPSYHPLSASNRRAF